MSLKLGLQPIGRSPSFFYFFLKKNDIAVVNLLLYLGICSCKH